MRVHIYLNSRRLRKTDGEAVHLPGVACRIPMVKHSQTNQCRKALGIAGRDMPSLGSGALRYRSRRCIQNGCPFDLKP